jgi:hypothetical protein
MHECDFYSQSAISTSKVEFLTRTSIISTRMSVSFTHIVRFSHEECDFLIYECDFYTQKFPPTECDLDPHECYFNTLRVI